MDQKKFHKFLVESEKVLISLSIVVKQLRDEGCLE